jgi:hypothetical protein
MEEAESDAQGDLQARDLGMGYDDNSGYITGNETDAPDSDETYRQDTGVPAEIPIQETRPEDDYGDPGEPGEGDSHVGLGGATGTERFDEDPRGGGLGSAEDVARTGDADMRTEQAVYQQYEQRRRDEGTP